MKITRKLLFYRRRYVEIFVFSGFKYLQTYSWYTGCNRKKEKIKEEQIKGTTAEGYYHIHPLMIHTCIERSKRYLYKKIWNIVTTHDITWYSQVYIEKSLQLGWKLLQQEAWL